VVGWLQEGLAWWYWHLAPYEHTHLSGTMCKSGTRINKDWVASRQWQNSQYSPFKHGTFAQYPDQSKTISTSQVSSLKEINDITNNICSHRHVYTKLHMIQSEELIQNWFQLEKGGGDWFWVPFRHGKTARDTGPIWENMRNDDTGGVADVYRLKGRY
jgi:hypothetical protein